jgi:predicted DNA-binding protein with PD1-like motif
MKMLAIRLKPNQDLKTELEKIVDDNGITSGFIATCVGSLHQVTIRMAGAKPEKQDIRTLDGHFEIVSLVGTVSVSGTHLHISVSDQDGAVIGGHLKQGSLVTTTAEIVIGYDDAVTFDRVLDPETGFDELDIK